MATAILNEPCVTGNPVIPVEALTPILYKDVPVLTTALLSAVYGTTQTRIRENYRVNRDRFAEGKHLFKVSGEELRALKECVRNSDSSDLVPKTGGELTLWTERGAARHAKMLNTDKAWDVFELLEENYFNRQQAPAAPATPPATLSTSSRLSIQNLIAAKVSHYPSELRPKAFKEAWSRVKNKFQVAKYEEIPEAVYPDVVSYILAMEMKVALPTGEQPKALPAAAERFSSIRDYASIFRGLPDKLDYWSNLSRRLVRAHDVFQAEMDAIKKDALRPFRENRRIEVATFLDYATVEGYKRMFEIAEDSQHIAYKGAYGALVGLESLHELLVRG
jgi:ORF6N domain./ORF6C domain.